MASLPHWTKVEAGRPLEAGEGLEFSRSHAGLQPPPRHGQQPLSRKGAYSCFLPSKTCSITSLSQLICPLQSKKYNHCYHRQSSMHAFPFPPPCSKSRKRCCSFLSSLTSHRLCQHDGPVADRGTTMIPNPEMKAWGHRLSWLQLRLGQIFLGGRIPAGPLLWSDTRLHIWADADVDLDQSCMFWDNSSALGSASGLAGGSLGCKSWEISLKIRISVKVCFSALFFCLTC